jgi:hypothetical protein
MGSFLLGAGTTSTRAIRGTTTHRWRNIPARRLTLVSTNLSLPWCHREALSRAGTFQKPTQALDITLAVGRFPRTLLPRTTHAFKLGGSQIIYTDSSRCVVVDTGFFVRCSLSPLVTQLALCIALTFPFLLKFSIRIISKAPRTLLIVAAALLPASSA